MNICVGIHWADYFNLFNVRAHFLHNGKEKVPSPRYVYQATLKMLK